MQSFTLAISQPLIHRFMGNPLHAVLVATVGPLSSLLCDISNEHKLQDCNTVRVGREGREGVALSTTRARSHNIFECNV